MSQLRVLRSFLLFLFLACTYISAAASNRVTPKEAEMWREDLRYLAAQGPRVHKNFFHAISKESFDVAVKRLDERIPILSRERIIVDMAKLVAMVGDGHTRMPLAVGPAAFRWYPVKLYMFKDGLYVRAAENQYANVVGGKVKRIGKMSTDDALKTVGDLVSFDSRMQHMGEVPFYLTIPEVLSSLDVIDDPESMTLIVEKGGKEVSAEFKPIAANPELNGSWEKAPGWTDARDRAPVPLWLKDTRNQFWFEYLKDKRTLYVQYNAVLPKPDETIAAFFGKVLKFAETNPVDKFVLDVRLNHGGNNFFNLPIFHGFIRSDKVNQRGKLFTIIGRQTFSAAMNCVNGMEKHTRTLFVGEPTGASPNHFGDSQPIELPNSKLPVFLSTLWWQDMDPRDGRKWRAPDIAAELTFDQYRQGVDPALEAVLNYGLKPTITDQVKTAVLKGDLESARTAIREFKRDPANYYILPEADLNRLGYDLINEKQPERAISVFALVAEAYPDSANAFDSLGEGYMLTGNKELAAKNYRRSLELNPQNGNARVMLRRLEGQ